MGHSTQTRHITTCWGKQHCWVGGRLVRTGGQGRSGDGKIKRGEDRTEPMKWWGWQQPLPPLKLRHRTGETCWRSNSVTWGKVANAYSEETPAVAVAPSGSNSPTVFSATGALALFRIRLPTCSPTTISYAKHCLNCCSGNRSVWETKAN